MRKSGFTLIEVLAALAILAVAVGLLATANPTSVHRLAGARQMRDAGSLARLKMAEIVRTGPPQGEEETLWEPTQTTDLAVHGWWKKRLALVPLVPGQPVPDPATTLHMLEISVRLEDIPEASVFRLATLFPPTATSGP